MYSRLLISARNFFVLHRAHWVTYSSKSFDHECSLIFSFHCRVFTGMMKGY